MHLFFVYFFQFRKAPKTLGLKNSQTVDKRMLCEQSVVLCKTLAK